MNYNYEAFKYDLQREMLSRNMPMVYANNPNWFDDYCKKVLSEVKPGVKTLSLPTFFNGFIEIELYPASNLTLVK